MSAAKFAYFQGLEEFIKQPIFVGTGEKDLEKEAKANTLCIDITTAVAKECSVSDLLRFFDLLTEDRRKQLKKVHGRKMKFYAWYDGQSGQLRANLISPENLKLPLGEGIQDASLVEVLGQFLGAKKAGDTLSETADGKRESVMSANAVLKVFQVML